MNDCALAECARRRVVVVGKKTQPTLVISVVNCLPERDLGKQI